MLYSVDIFVGKNIVSNVVTKAEDADDAESIVGDMIKFDIKKVIQKNAKQETKKGVSTQVGK